MSINKITNCEFTYKCPLDWNSFDETDEDSVRFCNECSKKVFRIFSPHDLYEHALKGDCVVLDESAFSITVMGMICVIGDEDLEDHEVSKQLFSNLREETNPTEISEWFEYHKEPEARPVDQVYKETVHTAFLEYEEILISLQGLDNTKDAKLILKDLNRIKKVFKGFDLVKVIKLRIVDLKQKIQPFKI